MEISLREIKSKNRINLFYKKNLVKILIFYWVARFFVITVGR